MDVFYILTSVWKKNHKMCIWNRFFAACSADLSCLNGSRIQLMLYANCFLGLTYGFLNKNFQEINLFICHCSFITLAQETTLTPQIVRFLETFRQALSWIKTEVLFSCSALRCYSYSHSLLVIQEFLQFCSVQRSACCSFSLTCALLITAAYRLN